MRFSIMIILAVIVSAASTPIIHNAAADCLPPSLGAVAWAQSKDVTFILPTGVKRNNHRIPHPVVIVGISDDGKFVNVIGPVSKNPPIPYDSCAKVFPSLAVLSDSNIHTWINEIKKEFICVPAQPRKTPGRDFYGEKATIEEVENVLKTFIPTPIPHPRQTPSGASTSIAAPVVGGSKRKRSDRDPPSRAFASGREPVVYDTSNAYRHPSAQVVRHEVPDASMCSHCTL